MPFRIRVTLIVLVVLAAAVVLLPLIWPGAPLEGAVDVEELRGEDATLVPVEEGLRLHAVVSAGAEAEDGSPGAGAASGFVFLHGFGSNLRSFAPLMDDDALGGAAPAVAYDRPGFGLTDRPLGGWERNPYGPEAQVDHVLAVMDHVGLERAVLVGNSAGGAIALRVAALHPARVEGLVLLAPTVYQSGGAPTGTRWLLYTPQLERLGPLLMRRLGGESGESFLRAAYADPDRLPREVLEAYRDSTSVHDWDRALWEVTQAGSDAHVEEVLGEVDVPVLVLSGDADEVVPAELSRRVAEALPSARFAQLEGCGHRPQEECPEAVAREIRSWLAEAETGR